LTGRDERGRPRGAILSPLVWLLIALVAGCGGEPLYRQESYVFGTRVELAIWAEEGQRARDAAAAVLREFDRLHRMLHAWEPSEVTRLNDAIARGDAPIPVSAELARILLDAAAIAESSEHLFNPVIGALVRVWGFHGDTFVPRLPPQEEIVRLVRSDPSATDLKIENGHVSSRNHVSQVDLGGFAKGYALDRAVSILRSRGIRNALVNIGGNVAALGAKGKTPWRIGIQHPRATGPLAALDLHDGESIGTSGDYQRFFEIDGRRYCHLIDPRTGTPARGVQAVTVLVPARPASGALSDAASKPLFIAEAARWRQLARRLGVEHVMRVDAQGKITVTRAMRARVEFLHSGQPIEVVD
jgi:thiamine biosynthesis lipoprotein